MRGDRRLATASLAVGIAALVVGAAGLFFSATADSNAPKEAATTAAIPAPTGSIARPARQAARPTELIIPEIGVRTRLTDLGVEPDGTLQVPSDPAVAGWYTGSARPGAVGPAIIVGHVDSVSAPAVFYELRRMRPGERVYVRRADGTLVVFRVRAVHSYPKVRFPSLSVYGPTSDAELRLITCGGVFDPSLHSYLSNIVVYATATS